MKITYDKESDAAYIYLTNGSKKGRADKTWPGEGDAEGINLDFDSAGRLIGVEVLGASRRLPRELLKGR